MAIDGETTLLDRIGRWIGEPFDPDLARDELLHELFEANVDARPDATALICDGEAISYAELERRANRLANYLRSKGVERGQYVAMLLPRGSDVYVALLAILKTGAAYVPLDPEYPPDRVAYTLADCKVRALVTTDEMAAKHRPTGCDVVRVDAQKDEIAVYSAERLTRAETGATREDVCYVIYTSGSTGRPKGVPIEHRSACNLVRAEGRIFQVQPSDRVYQGFSIAFDASVEEVWLAFFARATLVVGTAEMVHSGPQLSRMLMEAKVTVLSCVPTLLSMMHEDVPAVRLLIVGGEACPADLVRRWCRAGRRMVNTYGPTEATVIATYGDLNPEKPVTIGRPVPNYQVYLLDEQLRPVAIGQSGEICIGGIGLARGYLGREELTAQKFVANPFSGDGGRLYRTGDLGRYTAEGEIEFLGRLDTQVKIRGFRVELSEIESVLMELPEVLSAAVVLHSQGAIQQLVAYVIPRNGAAIDEQGIRTRAGKRLPPYMVPAIIEQIDELPTLSSGKVDRNRLPAPQPQRTTAVAAEPPTTRLEKQLAGVWERIFLRGGISIREHFFTDLGGHSLLAASLVSELREVAEFRDVSVLDVYNHPTIQALAGELERRAATKREVGSGQQERVTRVSRLVYRLCTLAQLPGLYLVIGFYSLQWLAPYVTYGWMREHGHEAMGALVGALAILLGLYPVMLILGLVIKWAVIGRYRAGQYRLWGWYYLRWWFVNRVLSAMPIGYLTGTPLLGAYYRLMGAKVGANVYLGTDNIRTFDLLSVGDDSSVCEGASLLGYSIEDGLLKIGPITLGEQCYVGARSVIKPYGRLEDEASLSELSLLAEGMRIPRGQCWAGSPARPLASAQPGAVRPASEVYRASLMKRFAFGLMHQTGILVLPVIYLLAILPGMMYMNYLDRRYESFWWLFASPLVAVSFVVLLSLEIVAVKWLLLGRVKAGRYPVQSWFYVRKWFFDQLMDISLDILGPLYATIYLNPWYRLLGARLGKNAEVSTATATAPDLLSIDDESFVADCVSLGVPRVDKGIITIAPTRIGKRAFIGNSAVVPAGSVIGDSTLIGVLSAPPLSSPGAAKADTAWLGSPAIFLPQRQSSVAFDEQNTFKPTRKRFLIRAAIEYFRVTLPATCFIALTCVLISVLMLTHAAMSEVHLLLLFPLLYAACGVLAMLIVVVTKWLLLGRYHKSEKPLWSTFVWRTELLTAMHEHLADPFLVELLLGTPFVCWFFRMLGAKIGRRVYMETTALTEFDLIRIGDDAMLNCDCTVQTHLFEDRVMKMSTIDIGQGCSVGADAVVLYDSRMEAGSMLSDLSLLMKGESLPKLTCWEGTPARRVPAERSLALPGEITRFVRVPTPTGGVKDALDAQA